MISVIVPLYNYRKYIVENINSIRKQSFNDWELIIVDDGSTDNPLEVISPYLSDKIKYIKKENNEGYGAAKNTGIQNCSGDYVVVLDADDMLIDVSLQCRIDYMVKNKCDWIHAKALEFHDRKPYEFKSVKRKATKRLKKILQTGDYGEVWRCIHAQTVMVKKSVYEIVGLYDESFRSMGDKEMWARILHHVGPPCFLNKNVVYYRQHDSQMHRSSWKIKNLKNLEKKLHRTIEKRSKSLSGVKTL